jgi:glycosyltransferase involved in cell wall biosynthesis
VKIVAILQTYNEQRFIGDCLDHLAEQGISAYLVDNESTDDTVAIAERRLGRNLIGIETLPRDGHFALRKQLTRKQELAQSLDADWLIHLDADEFRVSPAPGQSLAQALAQADAAGFNAVNFVEFVFLPTLEEPDHDHADYLQTMRFYYPYLPRTPHRLNAWKRQDGPIELTGGGHLVRFPGLSMAPQSMYSRHYLLLSIAHAARKFGPSRYAPDEVAHGWHRWRVQVDHARIELHSQDELREYAGDHLLDASEPHTQMSQFVNVRDSGAISPGWLRRAVRGGRSTTRRLKRAITS